MWSDNTSYELVLFKHGPSSSMSAICVRHTVHVYTYIHKCLNSTGLSRIPEFKFKTKPHSNQTECARVFSAVLRLTLITCRPERCLCFIEWRGGAVLLCHCSQPPGLKRHCTLDMTHSLNSPTHMASLQLQSTRDVT